MSLRGKGKNIKKVQEERCCDVCKFKFIEGDLFEPIQCSNCGIQVHRYCYAPDFKQKQSKSKFKCDECKRKQKIKGKEEFKCSLCGIAQGILKDISGEWMHVLCALTSPKTLLKSYQTLSFISQGTPSPKKKQKCSKCQNDKAGAFPCIIRDCKIKLHLNCLVHQNVALALEQANQNINVSGLLDRNEGILLSKIKKQMKLSPILKLLQTQGKEPFYVVCKDHNDSTSYIWCPCNQFKQDDQSQCQVCKRWYHNGCNYFTQTFKQICKECISKPKDKNIFVKYMSLPELIYQAIQVQKHAKKLDNLSIKFLDHFVFKYSTQIDKAIEDQDNRFPIQRHFLKNELQNIFESQMQDQNDQARILEILHYITKRQYKEQSQITGQNLEEILGELNNKASKFHRDSDHSSKKYRQFLEDKLMKISKDDVRQIKIKLNIVAQQLVRGHKTQRQVTACLYPPLRMASNSQTWLSVTKKQGQPSSIQHLFEFLISAGASEKQLHDIIRSTKILLRANKTKVISEKDLIAVALKIYPELGESKEKSLKAIQNTLIAGVSKHKVYQSKKEIAVKIRSKYDQSTMVEKANLRSSAINNGVFISHISPAFHYEIDAAQFEIYKKRFLKRYSLSYPQDLNMAVQELRLLFAMDKKNGLMAQDERLSFQSLEQKFKFYLKIFNYSNEKKKSITVNDMQQGVLQEASLSEMYDQKSIEAANQQLFEKDLSKAIKDWPLDTRFQGLLCLKQICAKKANLSKGQSSILAQFFDRMFVQCQTLINGSGGTYKFIAPLLSSIVTIAKFFNVEQRYDYYIKLQKFYNEWKAKLEQKCSNIEKILENAEKTKELLTVIADCINEIPFQTCPLSFQSQLKKLKVMKMWALFSQKILSPQKKATLTAIQNVKTLMDKINYPRNSVRAQIQKLDQQSKSLDKKIRKFLERPKVPDFDFHEQLRYVESKMTLKQAQDLQRELENSELDVEIQLNELKEEISNCKFIIDISQACQQAKKSQVLGQLRKKIIEGPFAVCTISDYQKLLRTYNSRKCDQYSGITTKKQYYRLLNNSNELSSLQLFKKTQALYKIYKDIEVAQREVLSSKPRYQLLLSHDIKKIKLDLHDDPSQFSRIEKYYHNLNKLRNRFIQLRDKRAQIQKFSQLQSELSKIPFNTKDFLVQIGKLKKELQDLTVKAKFYLDDKSETLNLQFDSPYSTQLLNRYQKMGIRNQIMNKFQAIVLKSKQISDTLNKLSIQSYKTFNVYCSTFAELQKNQNIYAQRFSAFNQMYQVYMEHPEPLVEVGCTLMNEGGFLVRRPKVAQNILPLLLNVKNKIFRSEKQLCVQEKANNEEAGQEDFNSDEELSNSDQQDDDLQDSQNLSDQDDVENIDLEDLGDISDLQDENQGEKKEDKKQRGKKRARPQEDIVISDQD